MGWKPAAVLALMLVLVWYHAAVLAPFILATVLAYVLRPLVVRLVAWRMPLPLAITLCLLMVAVLGATLVVLLVPIVSELVPLLRNRLPDLAVQIWRDVMPWFAQWGIHVPESVDEWRTELTNLLQNHVPQWSGALWRSLVVGGSNLIMLVGLAVLVPMLAFYFMLDWPHLTERARMLLPVRWRHALDGLVGEIDELMGQYLRGQLIVMLILAVYYSVGLGLAGFSLALPIGVFTGLAVCIPYVGFGLGLVLALLAGVVQFAPTEAGWVYPIAVITVIYGIGQAVESFFLTPRLVGERIGLHPLGVILALMLFGQWLGFWGLLIALPCTALFTILARHAVRVWQGSRYYLSD
jgi:predicted PurR-regulated permease PerM